MPPKKAPEQRNKRRQTNNKGNRKDNPPKPGQTCHLPEQNAEPQEFCVGDGSGLCYFGQKASLCPKEEQHKLLLTASNGFFTKGRVQSVGKRPSPEKDFINSHFDALEFIESRRPGTVENGKAKWYVWMDAVGHVTLKISFGGKQPNRRWNVAFGNQEVCIGDDSKGGEKAKASLVQARFLVENVGKHLISVQPLGHEPPSTKSRLESIELTGEPVEKAVLLRIRWRPSAIHPLFASTECPAPKAWIFESKSLPQQSMNNTEEGGSHFSPMTTPFGYFGGSFDADGRSNGLINFSMWAASRNANEAPPLNKMPHLLATGHPQAEFGGFGHEGTGVKIRNWNPLDHRPKSIIQALRMDSSNDGMDTYYGYVYDDRIPDWKLFAVGRLPSKGGKEQCTLLSCGSFCEVPGPPHVERTGDILRNVARRGWVMNHEGKLFRVDKQTLNQNHKAGRTNKFISVTNDGWFETCTGGLELVQTPVEMTLPSDKCTRQSMPDFLKPGMLQRIQKLPVTFGPSKVLRYAQHAMIQYSLLHAGTNAKGTLYYGPFDAITFVQRELHQTEQHRGVCDKLCASDRTWADSLPVQSVEDGMNQFRVSKLCPETRYYFRLFVENEEGKSWDFQSGVIDFVRNGTSLS